MTRIFENMQSFVSVTDSSRSTSVSASRFATPDTGRSPVDSVAHGLDNLLSNVHLSSPAAPDGLDMSAPAVAIDTVESAVVSQDPIAPPDTSTLVPEPRRSDRRRSSRRSSGRVVMYDFDQEELPPHRLYRPEVQGALRDGKALMGQLAAALASSTSRMHRDERAAVRRLQKQAAALADFQLQSTWTVGFVGETGAGKTTLLNSLMHQKNLATVRNNGRACTSVATEFRYRAGGDFTIEVELFGEDQLVDQLATLVCTYRSYHAPGQNTPPSDALSTGTGEAAAEEQARKDAKNALSMLWILFGAQIDAHMPLLTGDDEDHAVAVLARLVLANREALSAAPTVFATAEACAQQLTRLSVDPRTDKDQRPPESFVPWPYIRAIRVYLDAHVLSKGLVLVDLPGLGDRNAAREAVTESYLVRCDSVFAVDRIDRVVSRADVERVLDLARQAKLENAGVVCTHADDFGGTEKIEVSCPRASQLQQLQSQMQFLERDIGELEELLYDSDGEYPDSGELSPAMMLEMHKSKDRMTNMKATCEFQILQLRTEDRNEDVQRSMHAAYRERLPGGIQNIFCVGNTQYWAYWDDGKPVELVDLSGIPRLRRHCLAKVADSQLGLLTKYIQDSIPALVCDVELWLASVAAGSESEQNTALREALDSIEYELIKTLRGQNKDMAALFAPAMRATFDKKIYLDQQRNRPVKWAESAVKAADEWNCWNAQTYIAFCTNYGNHQTKASGKHHNWNEEAMKGMVGDLTEPWRAVCRSLSRRHVKSVSYVMRLLQARVTYLNTTVKAPPELVRSIRNRNQSLTDAILEASGTFESALHKLGINALAGLRTGLFGAAMEDAYNDARLVYGDGCTAEKRDIINNALGDPALFRGIMTSWRDSFVEHATTLDDSVSDAIGSYLVLLGATFDMVRSQNAAAKSEIDQAFTDGVAASVEAAKDVLASLQRAVQ